MKKFLLLILILVIGLLCWSPWLATDGASDAIFKVALSSDAKNDTTCQEQPWSATWAPFSQKITHCNKSWYVTFWGQIF